MFFFNLNLIWNVIKPSLEKYHKAYSWQDTSWGQKMFRYMSQPTVSISLLLPFPTHGVWLESCRQCRGCRWGDKERRQCREAPCRCRIWSWCWVTSRGSCHSPPPRTCWGLSCAEGLEEEGRLPVQASRPTAHWLALRVCRRVSWLSTSGCSAPGWLGSSQEGGDPAVGPPHPDLLPHPPCLCSEGPSASSLYPRHISTLDSVLIYHQIGFFIPNVSRRPDELDWWFLKIKICINNIANYTCVIFGTALSWFIIIKNCFSKKSWGLLKCCDILGGIFPFFSPDVCKTILLSHS